MTSVILLNSEKKWRDQGHRPRFPKKDSSEVDGYETAREILAEGLSIHEKYLQVGVGGGEVCAINSLIEIQRGQACMTSN